MKEIAIVTYSLEIGGLESVLFNLAKTFESLGNDVEIIETLRIGKWHSYFIDHGIHVITIPRKHSECGLYHAEKIRKYLEKFELILLNDAPIAQSSIGKLSSGALIFPILHLSLETMASNAAGCKGQWNKIVAVSPYLKNYFLRQQPGISGSDVVVIPNGIDTDEFCYTPPAGRSKKRVLFLGRISEEKGVLLLPAIISELRDHPQFERLDVYGGGPLENILGDKIREWKLEEKIIMKGPVPHDLVSKTFGGYDILLMPSYIEGHPIVLLEAMSSGLVPVVSRIEGSTDIIVEPGINGFLCEAGNPAGFASALRNALEQGDLSPLSLAARETIVQKYTVRQMGQSYLGLFRQFEGTEKTRTGKLDISLLGDLPFLPYFLVRPVRKALRMLGLWKKN